MCAAELRGRWRIRSLAGSWPRRNQMETPGGYRVSAQIYGIDFDRGAKGPLPTSTDGTSGPRCGSPVRGHGAMQVWWNSYGTMTQAPCVPPCLMFLPGRTGAVMWLTGARDRCFLSSSASCDGKTRHACLWCAQRGRYFGEDF